MIDDLHTTLSPMLNSITNSKRGLRTQEQQLTLHIKHAECITIYPAHRACFTINIDAPGSRETHQTAQTGGQ